MRDKIPQTLKKLDEYLFTLTKGRYGLYEFSRVVAYEICISNPSYMVPPKNLPDVFREGRPGERKLVRAVIRKLGGLKKRFIKVYSEYLQLYGERPENVGDIESQHPDIFQKIEEIERDCKERLTRRLPWIKKGHLTDTKNKIAFIFAQVIKRENGQPDWAVIESLLIWFWKRLKKTTYSNELAYGKSPEFITEKTLSNAYSKAIKNADKKLNIEQSAGGYFRYLELGFAQQIAFRKNYIQFGSVAPLGMKIWSRLPLVFFPDGKILKETMGRKRRFQKGRSWDRKMSRLIDGWVAFQKAARREAGEYFRLRVES